MRQIIPARRSAATVALAMSFAILLGACAAPGAPAPTAATVAPSPEPAAAATVAPSPEPTAAPSPGPAPSAAPTPSPAPAAGRLPRPVYFLSAANAQVTRLEIDGATARQITFEELPVRWLAVADRSGTIVYATADNDGLGALYALDGAGRRKLMEGTISHLALSPDGQRVLYRLENAPPGLSIGQNESPAGVWVSSTAGMRPSLYRADAPSDQEFDPDNPAWVHFPVGYSPDGTRVALTAFDADGPAIPGGRLLIFEREGPAEAAPLEAPTCCEQERWSLDSGSLLVAGGAPGPDLRYGLYRIDATTGAERAILDGSQSADVPLVSAPQQLADGQIYAFVELLPADRLSWEHPYRPALARVSLDGEVTALRPADLPPSEVLWDPQAAGALITQLGPDDFGDVGGRLIWLPVGAGAALETEQRGYAPRWAAEAPLSAGDCAVFAPIAYEPAATRVFREEARDVQLRLAGLGFVVGPPDGFYGDQTRAAVEQLQVAAGLPASGNVDCATWQALLTIEGEGAQ